MPGRVFSPFLLGCLCSLCATIFWSGNFVVGRALAGQLSPVELSFWRWGGAFIFILPFTLKSLWAHRDIFRAHWKTYVMFGLLGVSYINVFNYKAAITTGATNIALIATTSPVFLALLCRLIFKEKMSRQQYIGLSLALFGVIFLVTRGSIDALLDLEFTEGDLWALVGSILFALYNSQLRFRPAGMPPVAFLTIIFGIGTGGLLPLMGWEMAEGTTHWPTLTEFGYLFYLAMFTSVIAFFVWNKAIDLIGPVRTGIMYYSIPLFSCIESAVLLDEGIGIPQIVGGIMIIGGILFSTLDSLRCLRKS